MANRPTVIGPRRDSTEVIGGQAQLLNHNQEEDSGPRRRRNSRASKQDNRHVQLHHDVEDARASRSSIYMGSYTPRRQSRSLRTPSASAPASPHRPSTSQSQLENLLQAAGPELETYGVEEGRDGFFDGSFPKPIVVDHEDLMRDARGTLPASFQQRHPLSLSSFLPKQRHEIRSLISRVTKTRVGIRLLKSFMAFFIAYILCLVPAIQTWLGRYNYFMVLSVIINHPSRTVGSQLDGTVFTVVGSAVGLGWGAFALWISDSTDPARRGYGGVLATFLVIFMATIAMLRSSFIRLYQFSLCAGLAISYTCLADTSEQIRWGKLLDYALPWLFGQAISLLTCCTFFPDAGSRPLAEALHSAFNIMQQSLLIPSPNTAVIHRELAWLFVKLSQTYRDLVLDLSITRFRPSDVEDLRNIMQAVIRALLALSSETQAFDDLERLTGEDSSRIVSAAYLPNQNVHISERSDESGPQSMIDRGEIVLNIEATGNKPILHKTNTGKKATKLVASKLAKPTSKLLSSMRESLKRSDAVLMSMSGYRRWLGPPMTVSSDILHILTQLRGAMIQYDENEGSLMDDPDLPPTYSDHPEVVELFLFVHPVRQAASAVENLLVKVMEMQQEELGWTLYMPSYPIAKALQRTNATIRHDRGGVTAGFYFRSKSQLATTMKGMANIYKPLPHQISTQEGQAKDGNSAHADLSGAYEDDEGDTMDKDIRISKGQKVRHRLWVILHRAQGFETRFALKVVLTTSLISVPAWLSQSRGWWNANESWWAVVFVWMMMHPRVGGNFQDLVTRSLCAVLGAIWGGVSYGAHNGNPYVMAFLAAIYMMPMLYRFTQSEHPRSGFVGCISFVVVSLGVKNAHGLPSVVHLSWTRGVAFVVGIVTAIVVNWILWPFVARHELRKALSSMMIYSSIIYRGVVARYVYYEKGNEPGKEDIERSEMLEGRLREGFVRIRQLSNLTRHEIRLRGPFDPLPYSALIDACERFFEYLVTVRESSLFFHPHFVSDHEQAAESLLTYRRDAVAVILMNLYVLAGALKGDRKVPRYLPSAAAARKRLLDHIAKLEAEQAHEQTVLHVETSRKWSQIYSYSYNQSLTGCVEQLEQLERYTKEIVGEQGFDLLDTDDLEDLDRKRAMAHGILDGQ